MERAIAAAATLVLAAVLLADARAAEPETLRVMSFNLWIGGEEGKQPLTQSVKVIQAARADLVGLQETEGLERNGKKPDNARRIAEMLSWNFLDQGGGTAIISRFKIVGNTPNKWGAKLALPSGRHVWLFNAHLPSSPYQPYQLLKIPYNDEPFVDNGPAAIKEAHRARGAEVKRMLAEVEAVVEEKTPIFVTGDFNEPSPLDWTAAVAGAHRCPIAVRWPTTQAVLDAGFVDAYRRLYPDPLKQPGYTWTPTTAEDDPKDHHDRIDFVFVGGLGADVTATQIIGEKADRADVVVTPYPSDHRAVVATVTIK